MSTERDLDEREQREWQVQERALRAERAGERSQGDPAVAQYRLIARALRDPPLAPLPSDFAVRTAARVAGAQSLSEQVDVWLGRALLALLLLAGVAAVLIYNGDSLREFSLSVPERAAFRIQTLA
ncbi:MAG TPA: hypothetical protein VKA43_02685, partial [Gammaproteobacteria bacterium]|nr:hypothetical protein [Gammaproteobacteria bacterium]